MLCFQHIQPFLLSLYSTHTIAASVYQSFYLLYLPLCTLLCLFSSPASLYVTKPNPWVSLFCKFVWLFAVCYNTIFDLILWCSVLHLSVQIRGLQRDVVYLC